MARVRKREAAKRDLIHQWVWYAENASIEVADRFLEAADSTLRKPRLTTRERTANMDGQARTTGHAQISSLRWV
jgi:plasmid stabilization system protein ParE